MLNYFSLFLLNVMSQNVYLIKNLIYSIPI